MRVIQYLPYSYHIHSGGLEKIAQTISDGLSSYENITFINYSSDVIRGKDKNLDMYKDTTFIPSFDLVYNFPFPKLWSYNFFVKHKEIIACKPDIIITHTRFFLQSFIGGILAKITGARRIHIEHGSGFLEGYSRFIKFCSRIFDVTFGLWIFRQCDEIVTISNMHKQFIKQFTSKEITVIYNPIDYEPKERQRNGLPHVGFIASLLPRKGCDLLIQALNRLQHKQRRCTIVGDGIERKNLEELVKTLNLENRIAFVGSDDRDNRMHTFDIFVNPSYQEGLPTTVVEALFAKCIVVASDVGGTSEISGFDDLLLFEVGNIEDLIQKLIIAFDNPHYEGLSYISTKEKFNTVGSIKKYYSLMIQ